MPPRKVPVRKEEPSTRFSDQPRYIKFLVILSFPFYGTCRLGLKVLNETIKKMWVLGEKVLDVSYRLYKVCKDVYNTIAPKVWLGFMKPCIIAPVNTYIVAPIVSVVRTVFGAVLFACETVYIIMCSVFNSLTNAFVGKSNHD